MTYLKNYFSILLLSATMLLLVASCSDKEVLDVIYAPSATPEEVLSNLETYLNAQDMDGVISLFDEESVFVTEPEGEPLVGHEEISEGFQGFFDLGGQSDIQARNVIRSDDLALVIVDWTFGGVDSEGNAYEFGSTATDVLQQNEDGNWLYKIDNAFGVTRSDDPTNTENFDSGILETLDNLEIYLNTQNMEGVMSLFHEDGVFVTEPGGEPLVGHEEVSGGFQGFFDLGGQSNIQARFVIQIGDLALVIVDWTFGGIDADGNAYEFGATATDVLERDENGNWLYRVDNAFGIGE